MTNQENKSSILNNIPKTLPREKAMRLSVIMFIGVLVFTSLFSFGLRSCVAGMVGA